VIAVWHLYIGKIQNFEEVGVEDKDRVGEREDGLQVKYLLESM